jgi:hypothetical protein
MSMHRGSDVARNAGGNVSSPRGDLSDVRITITAYRGGDTFLFKGRISGITCNGITASVVGTLAVGELVCLQYSINSLGQTERYASTRRRQGEKQHFEFLSLNDRQIQCLREASDWLLAADMA